MNRTSELPTDAYYDLSEVGETALSPSGDRVAFTVTEFDPDEDERVGSLFVVPTDGSRDPHRLTRVAGASNPQWGPEGDRLAFLAAREEDSERRVGRDADDEGTDDDEDEADDEGADAGTDDEPTPQVWLFDLSLGGDAREVTDFAEGASSFDWSPSGDRLAVAARDPTDAERAYLDDREEGGPVETERLQHKLDGVGYTDTVTTYLHVVDVDTGEAERLDGAYAGGAFSGLSGLQPAWGASDRIAFVAYHGDDADDTTAQDVFTVDPDGGGLRKLTDGGLSASAPAWSPDGERLAFAAADPDNWYVPTAVYVYEDGAYEPLTADLDRTLARGASPEWADDETLYAVIADEARSRLARVSLGGTDGVDPTDATVERVFEAQGDDRALSGFDPGDDRAAFVLSHPSEGRDVYAVDTADLDADAEPDSLTRLSETNADLTDDYPMPDVRRVEWESDGHDISGVVYHDPSVDPADGDHPLVVAIHGGPISYDEPVFSFEHAVLTSRGYVVLRPNYRGGSSYGRAFAEALRGQWGTHEVDDIAAGVESLVDRGWVDDDRVFGYGFSYGGISQGFLVTQEPDLFTAAAPEHGIYDLRSAYGTDDSHVWMDNEYGVPWENREAIDASSAITDAGEIETPLLVTAGTDDWRCPPSQSEQLYVAAKKQGVDARFVLYEDEHHNVGAPDRAIHRLDEIVAWYERHDPAVDGDAEGEYDPHGRNTDE
ncbi:S9 family peptidase [Candidatus Halobonum tyrrellensis]|uniref:Dipeptidyl aminopeptidase/acylaminoacyl peptidase n=1 Tax=Candidatus Halobonum tyrrellensis G22 TaxID=1324957 RepID=V4IZE5_9EURY|nr:S9 family peptidase [Candidatus Halobonum tyrrellensis]ESP88497.1 dipeptidyl aminopeptidase/acylaminoacyl peptidase [Candidatus Halobonum tyrrellensis G22]